MQYIPDVLSYFQVPKEVKTKRFKRKSTKNISIKEMLKTSKKETPLTPSDLPISPWLLPKQDFRIHPY